MNDYKIVNKREILVDVVQLTSDSVLLKFDYYSGFNSSKDIYVLTLYQKDIFHSIRTIRDEYLYGSIVIVEEDNELWFHKGKADEVEDWNCSFITSFDKYEEFFVEKTGVDYNNELLFNIGNAVRTKAFQSVMNSDFLDDLVLKIGMQIDRAVLDSKERDRLKNVLLKARNLDEYTFFSAFMFDMKLDLK
ncbi:hypothetical protein ACQKCH_15510 [Nubsella zeaxanthinifaciens]|uniref:hypothetical protein n=1 Tax=Nubsella zeaxanthinifaciens TaxID=392412 RepID=UPI003CFFF1E1